VHDPYWNHTTQYHPLALRHVRPGVRALDVGSGEGLLTRRIIAAGAATAVGIDLDDRQTARARELAAGDARLSYVTDDVLAVELDSARFDLVTCFAALHHLDLDRGLERLRELTAPGGHLVVVGLARVGSPADAVQSAVAVPAAALMRRFRGEWHHGSPVRDPETTYERVRDAARRALPGVTWRRRLYWRYSLTWRAPATRDDRL
jgi:2-polyprenyl-3-methyl-5-hydroxy-6-metoxy-1,4-benzoquinol methylase